MWNWYGEPNFTLSGQKCGNTAPKTVKILNFGHKFVHQGRPTRLQYFYEILSVCTCLQVAFKFAVWLLSRNKHPSYKHFPAVGAFSHKFIIASSGETTAGIKKVKGCKNGTDLLYHHAKYGGNPGSRAGCRGKSVMFYLSVCFYHAFEWRSLW